MSRIGNTSISLPTTCQFTLDSGTLLIKGPKGELSHQLPKGIELHQTDDKLQVKRLNEQRQTKALHGLTRSLVANMVEGVTSGYTRKLELVGTGYRARKQGSNIILSVGYSHPVEINPIPGVSLEIEGETIIIVSGIDKQKVGHQAAVIRAVRKPEPYKGKGIRYQGEVIRRKAGKSTKTGA